MDANIPFPGSREAIAMGCTCPVLDNGHGNPRLGMERGFVMNWDCPLHGIKCDKPESQENKNA